jgi:hypothetical protein
MLACGGAEDASPVIATIDGIRVHQAQFDRFVALKMGEVAGADTPESLRSLMLDEYIRRRLVLDRASRAGLTITDAEIDQAAKESAQVRSSTATAEARQ